MDPVRKSAQFLAPRKAIQKRPSNEALEKDSKKQSLIDDTVDDPHISADEDN